MRLSLRAHRSRWLQEHRRDYYYRLAKERGYRSRAAYKLLQVVKSYGFMRSGSIVVDLGAAPGGWMQASREVVGEQGFVLGVDIKPIAPFTWNNVVAIVGDITDPRILDEIRRKLPGKPDVVLSDVAPTVSGVWEVDHARQIELARASLNIASSLLRLNGSFFVKVFQGDLLSEFINEMKGFFTHVRIVKPKASKARSSEIFLLGQGFHKPYFD